MNQVPIAEQLKIIKQHFPKVKIVLPKNLPTLPTVAEDLALLPHWTLVGKTYPKAVQKVLDALKKSCPFYNWREGQIDEKHLRESPLKKPIPLVLPVQTGSRWKGESVKTVREKAHQHEILLGAYEVGMILLTHPDRLTKYEDLWIDCPGDEFIPDGDGRFDVAPFFHFRGDELRFGSYWFGGADVDYGSASGFLPQSDSGTLEPLGSFDSSILDRLEKLEQFKTSVEKILKL